VTQWYAYEHENGSFHLRRYFGPLDVEECHESPFVRAVVGPYEAEDREEAWHLGRDGLRAKTKKLLDPEPVGQ
jgi:hypothetical protein